MAFSSSAFITRSLHGALSGDVAKTSIYGCGITQSLSVTQTFAPFSMTGAFELLSIVAQIYLYLGKNDLVMSSVGIV